MDRLARLIGIGMLVAVVAFSVNYYRSELEDIENRVEAKQLSDHESKSGGTDIAELIEQQPDPEYLAFKPGIKSGNYEIDDLPDSRDRDYEVRKTTSSSKSSSSKSSSSKSSNTETASAQSDRADSDASSDNETDSDPDLSSNLPISGSLAPGVYATSFATKECSYELHRVMKEREERKIGDDYLTDGRLIVIINEIEPDRFFAAASCGDWGLWSPLTEPLKVAPDSDYWVGDLARGSWVVPEGCLWEKVVGFRGSQLFDVQESGRGPERLVVDSKTLGVRVRGCQDPLVHGSLT